MKKLINDPKSIVAEMLEGAVALAPGQAMLAGEAVVLRHPLPEPARRRVAVLSGGGSGHEPAHAGYVGKGMLTAAIAGDVFTSPRPTPFWPGWKRRRARPARFSWSRTTRATG